MKTTLNVQVTYEASIEVELPDSIKWRDAKEVLTDKAVALAGTLPSRMEAAGNTWDMVFGQALDECEWLGDILI